MTLEWSAIRAKRILSPALAFSGAHFAFTPALSSAFAEEDLRDLLIRAFGKEMFSFAVAFESQTPPTTFALSANESPDSPYRLTSESTPSSFGLLISPK